MDDFHIKEDEIRELIKTNINHKFKKNNADIYLACAYNGYLDLMELLEDDYNWNINVTNSVGSNAYMYAAQGGHINILQHLEQKHKYRVKLDLEKKDGWSIFSVAKTKHKHDALYFAIGRLSTLNYLWKKQTPNNGFKIDKMIEVYLNKAITPTRI